MNSIQITASVRIMYNLFTIIQNLYLRSAEASYKMPLNELISYMAIYNLFIIEKWH